MVLVFGKMQKNLVLSAQELEGTVAKRCGKSCEAQEYEAI